MVSRTSKAASISARSASGMFRLARLMAGDGMGLVLVWGFKFSALHMSAKIHASHIGKPKTAQAGKAVKTKKKMAARPQV